MTYENRTEGETGSSSSSGNQALAERVIAVTPEGTEAEYAILADPESIRGNERWMFPARIRVAPDGAKTLLNPEELAARNAAWLAEAGWTREACSRWLFTWTAVQVRCDPAAAVEAVEALGMRPGRIAEGEPFALEGALGPVILARSGGRDDRIVLTGTGPVDPAHLHEQEVRAALVVAEVSGETLGPEDAAAAAAGIAASGTVSITLEIDAAGTVWRREDRSEYTMTGSRHSDGLHRAQRTVTRVPRAEWDRRQTERAAE